MPEVSKTIRCDESTVEKLKKIASDEFGSQGQALAALVQLWETQRSKNIIPQRAAEIDSFNSAITRIHDIYLSSLNLYSSTSQDIRDEVRREMTSQQTLIADLQERLKTSEREAANTIDELTTARKTADSATEKAMTLTATIEDKNTIIKSLSDRNTALILQTESTDTLLQTQKDAQSTIDDLTKQLQDERTNALQALLEVQQTYQEDITKLQNDFSSKLQALSQMAVKPKHPKKTPTEPSLTEQKPE